MKSLIHQLDRLRLFAKDRRGVSAVEYALIIVAVIAIIGGGAVIMGDSFKDLFGDLQTEMADAAADVTSKAAGTTPP